MKKTVTTYEVRRMSFGGTGRWGVIAITGKQERTAADRLTSRKAQRRARGLARGIMDESGRCLTRKERGLPPLKGKV